MCSSDIFLAVLAVFFPPIAVWIKTGFCTADSIINITLTLLCFFPGLIHAWYIILKYPEQNDDDVAYEPIPGGGSRRRDLENGNVTYYYVSHQPIQHPSQRGYGTVNPQDQQAPAPANKSQTQTGDSGNAGSSSAPPPPTYAEAVKGDNKLQSQD
ncbi:Proteolipid membrane potential modulator [Penicillium expansum]|uniref:Proteolipid membrane potential modulator n=1 Tax=Penicillium expansum TaxID=27334 RepID=A0A0A2JBT3_PENEN|nr:Proteolipid membrane potential modulator [Penicillium expansum]KAJ5491911.1 Proteolipid membrane potential modulator [Penicillium expansum]KGO41782.1 Proteolipid membrane potential modulator [Penicillium expansum]KGO52088.1 Proteolipid membrane potential modulator [Penicillium expansum]KGO53336.1 Proteolipid membrane potential modulator [Penicillium expansum]